MSGRSITRGPAPTSSLSERVQRILSSLLNGKDAIHAGELKQVFNRVIE